MIFSNEGVTPKYISSFFWYRELNFSTSPGSISDGKTCSLIFSYLPQDAKEYSKDLDIFINHPDFKKRLEILIYSQSDCCILRKDLTETHNNTIKEIVDFYR